MAEGMDNPALAAGGFVQPHGTGPGLPSPAPTSHAGSPRPSNLPHPRSTPLRAGLQKEEATRRFVDAKLLHVSRRYVKRFQALDEEGEERKVEEKQEGVAGILDEATGYRDFRETARDLGEVVGVLWLSGTPSLQIPYLLNIALSISTYLSSFPPSPPATFSLLAKLDHAFSSLLTGHDIETGEVLPGLSPSAGFGGEGMSKTDMVRVKSIVEATRVQVVEVMSGGRAATDASVHGNNEAGEEAGEDTDMGMGRETADETDVEGNGTWDGEDEKWNMDVARVYERTLMQLGKSLSGNGEYDVGSGG